MNSLLLLSVTVAAFVVAAFLVVWFRAELGFSEPLERWVRDQRAVPGPGNASGPVAAGSHTGTNRVEQALALLQAGRPCSEVVLGAYAPSLGLTRGEAFEIALRLGGRLNMTETCGAVTGAWIILGKHCEAAAARRSPGATFEAVDAFTRAFEREQGTISCRKLLVGEVCPARLRKVAGECALKDGVCPKLAREAAELLERMLN